MHLFSAFKIFMLLCFTLLQVIYMGVCVYTPAFALNTGMKSILLWLGHFEQVRSVVQSVPVFSFSYWIWIMGSSVGHWTSVHIVHNSGELLKVIFIHFNIFFFGGGVNLSLPEMLLNYFLKKWNTAHYQISYVDIKDKYEGYDC